MSNLSNTIWELGKNRLGFSCRRTPLLKVGHVSFEDSNIFKLVFFLPPSFVFTYPHGHERAMEKAPSFKFCEQMLSRLDGKQNPGLE